MALLLCCGPKMAACWGRAERLGGVIMLVLLGPFFNVPSAVLIEDIPATEEEFVSGVTKIHVLYDQVSYNCFIAAGLYFLLGGFCFFQVCLNKQKEYLVC